MTERKVIEEVLGFALNAPSPDNNQPWLFEVDAGKVRIIYDETKSLPSDERHFLNLLSIGMLVENIRVGAAARSMKISASYCQNIERNEPVVTIGFEKVAVADSEFHHAALVRRTDRTLYRSSEPLPEAFLRELDGFKRTHGDSFESISDRRKIRKIASHVYAADIIRFSYGSFVEEVARSLCFSTSRYNRIREGIHVKDLAVPAVFWPFMLLLKSRVFVMIAAWLGFFRLFFLSSKIQILRSNAIGGIFLGTDRSAGAYIKAGEVFERFWLLCQKHGISVHPVLSFPVFAGKARDESSTLTARHRHRLNQMMAEFHQQTGIASSRHPVVLFRFGLGQIPCQRPTRLPLVRKMSRKNDVGAAAGGFAFEEAFKRNIGLVTEDELATLRQKTVAIPGMGGVGGSHLVTLARMGVGGFHVADEDRFSLANFNRQFGAFMSTLDQDKMTVMSRFVRDINPEVRLTGWNRFISAENCREFLSGCDLVVDSLDAWAIEARRVLFKTAREMSIPVITAGPIGFSCALLASLPDSMSFEQYMNFDGGGDPHKDFVRFITGLVPRPHFLRYLDLTKVNSADNRGPSSAAAVSLCSAFTGVQAIKILLNRGKLLPLPYYHYIDPYLNIFRVRKLWFGNRNPVQRLQYELLKRKVVR